MSTAEINDFIDGKKFGSDEVIDKIIIYFEELQQLYFLDNLEKIEYLI